MWIWHLHPGDRGPGRGPSRLEPRTRFGRRALIPSSKPARRSPRSQFSEIRPALRDRRHGAHREGDPVMNVRRRILKAIPALLVAVVGPVVAELAWDGGGGKAGLGAEPARPPRPVLQPEDDAAARRPKGGPALARTR